MSLTLYSSPVSFASSIIFSMKFKAFHCAKPINNNNNNNQSSIKLCLIVHLVAMWTLIYLIQVAWRLFKIRKQGLSFQLSKPGRTKSPFVSTVLDTVITRAAGKKLGKLDFERFKLTKPEQPMLPTLIVHRFELFLLVWLSFACEISHQSLSSQLNLS